MAIPSNYIDKITKGNDSRIISIAADMVSVDNGNFEGADLNEVLDEVAQAISDAGETVVINSDGANIVDEHDNNSVLFAPSARQMKLMYNNLMAIYNGLAGIAFTNGKPTLDWVGSKTKYTLSYGTLTGCTADVAADQVNEGALRIKLTPTQASYAFTSVTVNGQSAQTTATGDADGSVYLDIIVNGNITVAATAISGRGITFNGTGCSIGAAGVAIGHDLDTTITANEHFTLPASITVKIGNANVTHTYTRAQDNKTATLHIDAANITGDLTITCTAVEEAHAVLNLSNVGSGVTVNKANNAHIYAGDTITILPASGNKVTASATVGGNAVTLNGNTYDGYTYTIGSGDVSSNGAAIAITATASALDTFSIDLTVTSDVGVTWTNPSAAAQTILEGSPFKITLAKVSGTGVLQISTSTMAGSALTPNNGVIETAHVTGDIVIAASVGTQPMKVHSWGYEPTTDDDEKRYLADSIGDFWLYNQADAGYSTNNYPSGYYANGVNGRTGYGSHRILGIPADGSFTVKVKGFDIVRRDGTAAYINAYVSQQKQVRFFDRNTVTQTSGSTSPIGQFRIYVDRSDSGTGTTADSFCAAIEYNNNSSAQTKKFNSATILVSSYDTHDFVLTYNAATKEVKGYLISLSSGSATLAVAGSLTVAEKLILPVIAYIPDSRVITGLDVYNYAMSQADIESEYGISNNE